MERNDSETPYPKLDLSQLRAAAERLRALLEQYAHSKPDAALCLRELTVMFNYIKTCTTFELRKMAAPCGYYFIEGSLRECPGLEAAYSEFSSATQGWSNESLSALFSHYGIGKPL